MASRTHNNQLGEVRILPIAVGGEIRAGESLCSTLLAASRNLRYFEGWRLAVKHKAVSQGGGSAGRAG